MRHLDGYDPLRMILDYAEYQQNEPEPDGDDEAAYEEWKKICEETDFIQGR